VLYWLLEVRVIGFRRPRLMKLVNRLARWHLRRQVPDPQLREKLTPDYIIGCKRILISDNYYPALVKPNVEVITTGVEAMNERSIVTGDGRELEVDTVIFGTGFHVTDPPIAARIHGRDGRSLAETWNSSMQAYLGTAVAGFPNLFFILGPNTGLGHNSMIYMVESQVEYVLDCLRVMKERGTELVEVRKEAQESYNSELQESMQGTVWTAGHCQSWYLDDTGRNTTLWPGWTFDFRRRTRRFDPDEYLLESRNERVAFS
jgi:cation diffusion facilitator CzcD-associated flavoprotein CzcO